MLNRVCANDVDVAPGRLVYTQWLNDKGGIEADLTVTRLSPTAFLIVTGAETAVRDFDWLKRHTPAESHAVLTDVSSGMGVISIMGPKARDLLQSLSPADLSHEGFPFATSREIELGHALVRASRAIDDAARRGDGSCAAVLPKDLGDWRGAAEFVLGPAFAGKDLKDISLVDKGGNMAGPLLARCGHVVLPPPGGDVIGRRRLDTHVLALEQLGAKVTATDRLEFRCPKLTGADVFLDEPSVTATENALVAAVATASGRAPEVAADLGGEEPDPRPG